MAEEKLDQNYIDSMKIYIKEQEIMIKENEVSQDYCHKTIALLKEKTSLIVRQNELSRDQIKNAKETIGIK